MFAIFDILLFYISVNSICWAPHEYGLMLVCGASDGAVSIVSLIGKYSLLCYSTLTENLGF